MTDTTTNTAIQRPSIRLGHVALAAQDPARLQSFYRDLVGLDVVRRTGNELAGSAVLFSGQADEEDHELVLLTNPNAAHVAFRVPDRDSLAAFHQRALAAGVPMPVAPQDSGSALSVFVSDPEGHHVEVYWATGRMLTPPRPLESGSPVVRRAVSRSRGGRSRAARGRSAR